MSSPSPSELLIAAVDEIDVVFFRRAILATRPAVDSSSQVGVGVANLDSGRARQVWKLVPSSTTDAMDRPIAGRPLLRELSQRVLGAVLRRVGPIEMLCEGGVIVGSRGAHGDQWELFPDLASGEPRKNDPLELLERLRAGDADQLRVTAAPEGLPASITAPEGEGERQTWSVLTLERCDEPFESVDLFARWNAR